MKITPSVIDYLGKYESGIVVLIGLMYLDNYYEGIFYYTNDRMIITIDDSLKSLIGEIELHEDFFPLMEKIINIVQPYERIINDLNDYELYRNDL
jgi:hypothetical protein